jgi:hypothetical protein
MSKLLKWKKAQVFNLTYWYAGHNEHTTRFTFNVDKTSEDYPYRLTMSGNYLGDFRTLRDAQNHSEMELSIAIDSLKESTE